ncbi:MAG: hypothetical protein HC897_09865 [Thermoanaerobaculia bacterium]|nr:hypothetical protein [Thermoanaerobaculia bacterium]
MKPPAALSPLGAAPEASPECLSCDPARAELHSRLSYVLNAHLSPGWVAASFLLAEASVRRAGTDPVTGGRFPAEVVFEIVLERLPAPQRARLEALATRGTRRIFVIFLATSEVCEWSAERATFERLEPDTYLEDEAFLRPLPIAAFFDPAKAASAVLYALEKRNDPMMRVIKAWSQAEGELAGRQVNQAVGKVEAVLTVLRVRGLELPPEQYDEILTCRDTYRLSDLLERAIVATCAEEIFA